MMTMLVTDMSGRERKRFAETADHIAEAATKFAVCLRSGDDAEVFAQFMLMALSGSGFIREVSDVFKDASAVSIPDHPDGMSPK